MPPDRRRWTGGGGWHPSDVDRELLRSTARGFRITAMLLLVAAVIAALVSYLDWRHERSLFAGAIRVPAVVTAQYHHARSSDRIAVVYLTRDGTRLSAVVPVGDSASFPTGRTIQIEYAPSDPTRARTVREWNPLYETALIASFVLLGGAVWIWIWESRWISRIQRTVADPRPESGMIAETLYLPAARGGWLWVVLWHETKPPPQDPAYAYRTFFKTHSIDGPTTVRVRGRLAWRSTVIAHLGDRVLWPLGRLHRPSWRMRRALQRQRRGRRELS